MTPEEISVQTRALAHMFGRLGWRLDSALRAQRKGDPTAEAQIAEAASKAQAALEAYGSAEARAELRQWSDGAVLLDGGRA